jgi:hypothetical protein
VNGHERWLNHCALSMREMYVYRNRYVEQAAASSAFSGYSGNGEAIVPYEIPRQSTQTSSCSNIFFQLSASSRASSRKQNWDGARFESAQGWVRRDRQTLLANNRVLNSSSCWPSSMRYRGERKPLSSSAGLMHVEQDLMSEGN